MTAVSASPAMMARWMERRRASAAEREACTLKHPRRGRSQHGARQDQSIGDDDSRVGAERSEGLLLGLALEAQGCANLEMPLLSAKA